MSTQGSIVRQIELATCTVSEMQRKNFFHPCLIGHVQCQKYMKVKEKTCNGFRMIQHAVVWCIWRARNDRIFNSNMGEVDELAEAIKVLSWRWFLSRSNSLACMFYEWHWNPKECLLRQGCGSCCIQTLKLWFMLPPVDFPAAVSMFLAEPVLVFLQQVLRLGFSSAQQCCWSAVSTEAGLCFLCIFGC